MRAQRIAQSADRRIASLAARQYGLVSRDQLFALRLGRGMIEHRLRSGRLYIVLRGVYAVGHPALSRGGHLTAAVLACGEGAVLSHHAAAEWWGLLPKPVPPIEVTVPAAGGRRCKGILVHRTSHLPDDQVVRVRGLAVTSVERTLLDLAARVSRRGLERMLDEAERLGLFDFGRIAQLVRAHPGRAGTVALRAVLEEHEAGSTRTRNDFEEAFLSLCDRAGLRRPLVNRAIGRYEVDFFWPDKGLVVECDGRASHATRRAFEEDRARDAHLTAMGLRVQRFTYRQVTRAAPVVADRLRGALGLRPGSR